MQNVFSKNMLVILIFVTHLVFSSVVFSDVKLPAIISDNMVLQQNADCNIWGWAGSGEKIEIMASWQGTSGAKTLADKDGNWAIRIKTPSAGGPYEIKLKAENEIKLENVLIGEVWVASGQSNMEMRLSSTENATTEIAAANYPQIRLFHIPRTTSQQPENNCNGQWLECSPETIADFSGVAYYFSKNLYTQLNIPIGIIDSNHGGSPVESWMAKQVILNIPQFKPTLEIWHEKIQQYPQKYNEYLEKLEDWERQVKLSTASGKKLPRKPTIPYGPTHHRCPSVLFNAMIHPILPYTIKGLIWYQGEGNNLRAYQYRFLFPVMIQDWRKNWGQGDFPFYFVQLANYKQPHPEPVEDCWAELREAQAMALSLPNTGMAVAIDIGDPNTIHPMNKKDVGKRLALWALAKDYGKEVSFSGPLYKSMRVKGNKIILEFDHTFGGLVAKDNKPLKHFSIAGPEKKFVWADAEIVDDVVVVSSPQIQQPLAVRYAWQMNPQGCNLYNKANLPASPFRTDNWPGITVNSINP